MFAPECTITCNTSQRVIKSTRMKPYSHRPSLRMEMWCSQVDKLKGVGHNNAWMTTGKPNKKTALLEIIYVQSFLVVCSARSSYSMNIVMWDNTLIAITEDKCWSKQDSLDGIGNGQRRWSFIYNEDFGAQVVYNGGRSR